MAGSTVSVTVEDREVRALFARLLKRGRDLTPAMQAISEALRTSAVENFEEGGRPSKWTPLSPETVRRKRNKRRILIEEGHLMDSITPKASGSRAEAGTSKVYAAIHQFGGKAGRGRKVEIPARPFLVIQDSDMREARDIILGYLMD